MIAPRTLAIIMVEHVVPEFSNERGRPRLIHIVKTKMPKHFPETRLELVAKFAMQNLADVMMRYSREVWK